MGRVRAFVQGDIAQVADLSWRFLHGRSGSPPPALETYFQQLLFHSPCSDSALPSLVYQDDRGTIVGFLGVVIRRMSINARPLRVAFGTGFIVHPDSRRTPAGLELVRSFFSGGQDLSLSETASQASQAIWAGFGGSTAPLYAMHWSRPLRPSLYGLHAMSRLGRIPLPNAFRLGSRPFCRVVDAIVTRMPSSPFRQRAPMASEEEPDVDTLLACLSDSWSAYSLRPEYDRNSLGWLLDFMGRMNARGHLRKVVLRDKERKIIGWYIYYLTEGGVGEVVQVGAAMNSSINAVLDHLSYDAWIRGAIALHGRLEPHLAQELSQNRSFLYLGNLLLVHSREPELVRLIQSGGASLTRLDGEWCLKFGESPEAAHPERGGWWSRATDSILARRGGQQDSRTAAANLIQVKLS
jgi:hypothetical protein